MQQALGPQTLEQPLGTRSFVRCDTRDELSAFDMLARRIFLAGILAGLVAGAFVTAMQAVKIWPLIAAAEIYEKAGEPAAAAHAG